MTTVMFSIAMVPTSRVNVRFETVQGTLANAELGRCTLHPEKAMSALGSNSKGKMTLILAE